MVAAALCVLQVGFRQKFNKSSVQEALDKFERFHIRRKQRRSKNTPEQTTAVVFEEHVFPVVREILQSNKYLIRCLEERLSKLIEQEQLDGLMWRNKGSEKPPTGTELVHEQLSNALRKKHEFSREELETFGLLSPSGNRLPHSTDGPSSPLKPDSFVKVGDNYFEQASSQERMEYLFCCREGRYQKYYNIYGCPPLNASGPRPE